MAFNSIKRTFLFAPSIKATNLNFSGKTTSGCTVTWTNGNGNHRYVFASDRNISFNPNINTYNVAINNTYTDTLFWQLIYTDTGDTFNFKTTTNILLNKKNYFFKVYELNMGEFGCSVDSLDATPLTGATTLVPLTTSIITGETFRRAINITNSTSSQSLSPFNTDGVIILGDIKPITGSPQENVVYPLVTALQTDWGSFPTIGDHRIVRNNNVVDFISNGLTKKITGLTGGTKFYFASFNYNVINGLNNSSSYSLTPTQFSGTTRTYFESVDDFTFIPDVEYTIKTTFKMTSKGTNFLNGIFFSTPDVDVVTDKRFTISGDTGDFNEIEQMFMVNTTITRKIRLEVGSIDGIYTDFILTAFNNPITLLLEKYGELL